MKKLLYPIVFALTAFLILYSCSAEEEDTTPPPQVQQPTPEPEPQAPTQYTLTVTTGEGGTVSTEGGTYDEGTEVTITATPSEGYEFVGWSDGETSFSRNINISADIILVAEFNISMPSYERYSSINETTSSFLRQKYFYRYLNFQEYSNLSWFLDNNGEPVFCNGSLYASEEVFGICNEASIEYGVHGVYDTWGDYNNDNKLDYFGIGWAFTQDGKYGNEKSQYIFIDNYFSPTQNNSIIVNSDYINWASHTSIADFDNDGSLDILVPHNNRHNNSPFFLTDDIDAESPYGNNSNEQIPSGPPVILYFDQNGEFSEVPFGPENIDTHTSTAGDINNDGYIDIIMMPWKVSGAGISPSPKIILNKGGRFFETIEMLSDYNAFIQDYPYNWNVLSYNLFDLDGDGNLDIIGGTKLDDVTDNELSNFEYMEDQTKGFHNNNKPWILWGNNEIQFKSSDIQVLEKKEHRYKNNMLGSGFTDFDFDGDIDFVILSTSTEGEYFYNNYELTLFENKGNRVFVDVTKEKIDNYYNMDIRNHGDFYSIAMIDKDNDGDFDIVPYSNGASFGGTFIKNLYWENIGGQFVRRELD